MLQVLGLPFDIQPSDLLSASDRALLAQIVDRRPTPFDFGTGGGFKLRIVTSPEIPVPTLERPQHQLYGTAVEGDRVVMGNTSFIASVDPSHRQGWLWRSTELSYPLAVTIQTAVWALLPGTGGLALHASAMDIRGAGLV
ncbi:MAG TPA: hypothetical protein PLS53_09390, partial [Thermoanaerobaculaceae bacterium]|nr:hypothetical protein [Thermoanaerobaculaceae bacterium]